MKYFGIAWLVLPALVALGESAVQERPGLFFREDWKESPPATPVTQQHVTHPGLVLNLYGSGRDGIRKSHHDTPADDPYYIWSGTCDGNWAVGLRHRDSYVDLTGQSRVRWRSKQAGFRQLRLIVKLASGDWLVSDLADGPSADWREYQFNLQDIRWRKLDIAKVVEGAWVDRPDLSRVDEIGFTDLMSGGGTPACSRLEWIEVYGKAVRRR